MAMHWHLELEILRVVSGRFTLHLEKDSYTLGPGDVAFIDAGELHGGIPDDAEYECVVFDPEMLRHRNYKDDIFLRDLLHHRLHLDPLLPFAEYESSSLMKSTIDNLFLCSRNIGKAGHELMICAYLKLFFAYYEQQGRYREDAFVMNNGRQRIEQLKNVLEYIEEHYSDRISLEELSRIAGLSERYFCSFFKELVGRTCFDYINLVKMEKAALMLSDAEKSISEISYLVGFDDCAYFSRLFKKYMGQSPRTYRLIRCNT